MFEIAMITVLPEAKRNAKFDEIAGYVDANDKMFILSVVEVEAYYNILKLSGVTFFGLIAVYNSFDGNGNKFFWCIMTLLVNILIGGEIIAEIMLRSMKREIASLKKKTRQYHW